MTHLNRRRLPMLPAICIGAFLSNFTIGSANIALPTLADALDTPINRMQWIVLGYLLTLTILLPMMGKLADRYGMRRIHNLGYIAFAAASLLAACSLSASMLIAARVLQGAAASMYQATNIGLISTHVSPDRRGQAMGWVSLAVALGAVSGPLAGGLALHWLSWPWLFALPALIMAAASIWAIREIPRDAAGQAVRIDGWGAAMFTLAIGMLVLALAQGDAWGWLSPTSLGLIAGGAAMLALFLRRSFRHPAPFLALAAMRRTGVRIGLIASGIAFAMANVALVAIPLHMASIGDTALHAGLAVAVYPIALACAGPLAGRWSDRYGSMPFVWSGLALITLSAAMLSAAEGALWLQTGALALSGIGMGALASPALRLAMQEASSTDKGAVGGLLALARNLGILGGSALGLGLTGGGGSMLWPMLAACFLGSVGLAMVGLLRRGRVRQRQIAEAARLD